MSRDHGTGSWLPKRAGAVLAALLAAIALGTAVVVWVRPNATAVELGGAGPIGEGSAIVVPPDDPTQPVSDLIVHVTGAVVSPGVYVLPPGARVDDAIHSAGGFAADADESLLNRAEVLRDGQQVYVPEVGEEPRADADGMGSGGGGPINVNTAPAERLEELPGIGPALAQRIVAYREANGPFTSAEGLTGVSGIGPRKLEGMIDMVTW